MLVPGDPFGSPSGGPILPLELPGLPWSAPRDSWELSGRPLGTLGILKNLGFPKGKQQRIKKKHLFETVERPGGPHDLWEVPRDPQDLQKPKFSLRKTSNFEKTTFREIERPGGPHDPK